MKTTTKLKIINLVKRVLKYQEPLVTKQQREIFQIGFRDRYENHYSANDEFIKRDLVLGLTRNLSTTDLIQFLELKNPSRHQIECEARIYVVKPIDK